MDWMDFFFGMCIASDICDYDYKSYYESDEYEEMIFQKKLLEKMENDRPFLT